MINIIKIFRSSLISYMQRSLHYSAIGIVLHIKLTDLGYLKAFGIFKNVPIGMLKDSFGIHERGLWDI